MKLGLIGLPMSGKSTIYSALTGQPPQLPTGKIDIHLAVVDVPDVRLEQLTQIYNPRRKTHARITYADIGGMAKGAGSSGALRNELHTMDAFLFVIRAFESDTVPHPEETVDPQRDLEILESEFILSDMLVVEKRIERLNEEIARGKNRDENRRELALFERLQAALESETPLRDVELTSSEEFTLKGYGLFTMRPCLIVLNMGDDLRPIEDVISVPENTPIIAIRGALEAEIAQLDPEDAEIFLEEYGIIEPSRDRVIRESYNMLRTQVFFTVGEDEVRAWQCEVGATAQKAAGEIHSDLERGFIRAEIIPWDTLVELGGIAQARQTGKLQLEGKDYIMREGDVMSVRFNV